ncbi:motility associated factor glycosyltransferase family protein [Phycisphaera mikurensis]|uniref:DUF115 domain-containing protein n=1 Tax=Phycisphaera mikurensis (strain NBRC 102666 / KCTC 22515 / FYK2301M01) TaxID=1142394 RepID=I0IBF5_PHYMF|nr:hypothetical protein [Phycisphaera mikurensis]MBB6442874.1 hypothetical protein [Phycisphaera mikurensis]BAM02593.1 hypothetical protein PSMK_04340 [Phycisphaera mikurensis NBRC 102666]
MPWRPGFPNRRKPLGYLRLLRARHRFHDRVRPGFRPGSPRPRLVDVTGDKARLAALRDRHAGRRCFVLGNGPSLAAMDPAPLRDEVTIGSNGLYTRFASWGFATDYLLFEDLEQTELRGPDLPGIRGPLKLAGLHNAYAFRADRDTVFFNARPGDRFYWDHLAPMFSRDFAEIVYLNSTVTTIGLQLAYHLGCDPVVLLGVDHDYGRLPALFKPGKIRVTADNLDLVRGCHFDPGYYKLGDLIGVPDVGLQERGYREARRVFERDGRRVLNATAGGKLEVFERVSLAEVWTL